MTRCVLELPVTAEYSSDSNYIQVKGIAGETQLALLSYQPSSDANDRIAVLKIHTPPRLLSVPRLGVKPCRNNDTMAQNPSQGIHKFPDELLLKIMEQTVSMCDDAVRLMLVCSRFKSIAASPTIWANCILSMDLSQAQISAIVRRSRGLPLRASIIFDDDDEHWTGHPSDAEKVLRHSELFEGLYIFIPSHFDEQWRSLPEIYPMPQLLYLGTSFMPRPIAGNKITQCDIVLDREPYSAMFEFLASVPLLNTLVIQVVFIGRQPLHLESLRQPVSLNKLKQMKIFIGPNCQLLANLFDNLVLDNLTDLAVVFSSFSIVRTSQGAAVARAASRYRSLARLLVTGHELPGSHTSLRFSEDTTIDSFECALLTNISNNLEELRFVVRPRHSVIRWSYQQGSYSSPDSVAVSIFCGKDLSTDAFLEIINSARRGTSEPKRISAILCPGVDGNRIREEYPNALVSVFSQPADAFAYIVGEHGLFCVLFGDSLTIICDTDELVRLTRDSI
ncbi:hypothetical protein ACEPAF_6143 [Sanghuangporus sanghuang]